jgi:hypothetical protein
MLSIEWKRLRNSSVSYRFHAGSAWTVVLCGGIKTDPVGQWASSHEDFSAAIVYLVE